MPAPHPGSDWPKHLPYKIAFVAEACGAEEAAAGRPLVGGSGTVFNQILRVAGQSCCQLIKRSNQ